MENVLLACILGVFLSPIIGLFVMPFVYRIRNIVLLASAKKKVAKGNLYSVRAKLTESDKATNFIKDPQSRYSNRKTCRHVYEFRNKKYDYIVSTYRRPPKEITLYFLDPVNATNFGQSHLQEVSDLFYAYRISIAIAFVVIITIVTTMLIGG